jgi:hypothetical protein
MHQSRERLVELPQRNIVVTAPIDDLAMPVLTGRPAMTPLRPPGSLIGSALFLFPIEFIVGQRATYKRQSFEPRFHALALGLQSLGFASQWAEPFIDRPAQTLLLGFLFRQELANLGRRTDRAKNFKLELDSFEFVYARW